MLKTFLKSSAKLIGGFAAGFALTAAATAQTDYASIQASPGIWTISDEDSTVYIFGTMHFLPPELDWRSAAVEAALDDAEIVYFEVNVSDPANGAVMQRLLAERGANPDGVTISSLISDDAKGHLAVIAGRLGVPAEALMQQIDPMQPWWAGLNLAIQQIMMSGYDPQSGVEIQLNAAAAQAGKQFGYFETLEEQMGFLSGFPMDLQVAQFEIGLQQMAEEPQVLTALAQAWAAGDLDRLDQIMNEGMADTPELYQSLLVDRNINWIPQIESALEGSDDALVAVGAGHLPGDQGVLQLLEDAGYTVTRQ